MSELPCHPRRSEIPKPWCLRDDLNMIHPVGMLNVPSLMGRTTTSRPITNRFIIGLGAIRTFKITEASIEQSTKIKVKGILKASAKIIISLNAKIIKTSGKIEIEYGQWTINSWGVKLAATMYLSLSFVWCKRQRRWSTEFRVCKFSLHVYTFFVTCLHVYMLHRCIFLGENMHLCNM